MGARGGGEGDKPADPRHDRAMFRWRGLASGGVVGPRRAGSDEGCASGGRRTLRPEPSCAAGGGVAPRSNERTDMPANRSRTENWVSSLQQILERRGAVEFTLRAGADLRPEPGRDDLVWRVRLLGMDGSRLIVGAPGAGGRGVGLAAGTPVVASYCVGQNRWIFSTEVERSVVLATQETALRLAMPRGVSRCARRHCPRLATAGFSLPALSCWPVSDPISVRGAEIANRALIESRLHGGGSLAVGGVPGPAAVRPAGARGLGAGDAGPRIPDEALLPSVGPGSECRLQNVSCGGLGLLIPGDAAGAIERAAFTWARLPIEPMCDVPLGLTLRRVHTHAEPDGQVYAGFAYEFAFHPEHQAFVASTVAGLIGALERAALAGRAGDAARRAA